MDSSMKLIIMMALVCFPVPNSLLLPIEASRSPPQPSAHGPDLLQSLSIFRLVSCEIECNNDICGDLHGLKKTLCVIACTVACGIIPGKYPATDPAFKTLHSCVVQNCVLVGKNEIDIDTSMSRLKGQCGV